MAIATVIGPLVINGEPLKVGDTVDIKEPAFSNLVRKGRIAVGDVSATKAAGIEFEEEDGEEIKPKSKPKHK